MAKAQNITVADICVQLPDAYHTFLNHGIDFCCGGARPLAEAAEEANVPLPSLLVELNRQNQSDDPEYVDWSQATRLALIAHIVDHYHRPLKSSIPILISLSAKVSEAHGSRHGEMLKPLLQLLLELTTELREHLADEEQVVFPLLLAEDGLETDAQVNALVEEHKEAGLRLEEIRHLTNDFDLPEDACPTFRAFWRELEEFDIELRKHIHLENNILFRSMSTNKGGEKQTEREVR